MKKLLLVILLSLSVSASIVSCTEEIVTPADGSADPGQVVPPKL